MLINVSIYLTECDVLIVCRQHNGREWKFKEQHARMWENIAGAKRYFRPSGFNIAGASAPAVLTLLGGVLRGVFPWGSRYRCPVEVGAYEYCIDLIVAY